MSGVPPPLPFTAVLRSEHWFHLNPGQVESADAAFTLSYAILMLNVDQHNPQARRVQRPMSLDSFRTNLSGIYTVREYDAAMLEEIYNSVRLAPRRRFSPPAQSL